jgi:hypothetical protein
MKSIITLIFLAILIPSISYGEDKYPNEGNENQKGVEALKNDLRELLSQEMKALQSGMMSIIPAYVSGNWDEIAVTAGKMKNSYILKQSLSESQVKQLHSTLPHVFIEKDKHFHYLAGMLEHVAINKKSELINFYYSEMVESCVGCHEVFATHKFPALSSKKVKAEHEH